MTARTARIHRGLYLFLLASASAALPAQEPWSDPGLPVVQGLELWLDASTLPAACEARLVPAPRKGEPLGSWPDGSGRRRDLAQAEPRFRPILWDLPEGAGGRSAPPAVRFDGFDDRLAGGWGGSYEDFTVIIVARPHSNSGGYRSFFAASERGMNDYQTGCNVDLGSAPRERASWVNAEGAGFAGERNLLAAARDFGELRVLTLVAKSGEAARLFADGVPAGERPRQAVPARAVEVRAGCRYYSHGAPFHESGFFQGDIAEILLYGRALEDRERKLVEAHLASKYAILGPRREKASQAVHWLVPGFSVREVPVEITNVNNIVYAPDGRLFAAGYDGRIHVLKDGDGDGLEETVAAFWYEPTIRTPIGMVLREEGLYVASHGKVSLLRDRDEDGQADVEEVLASGWPPPRVAGGGVDVFGIALDRDGSLYFGLGCDDFTNPYLVKDGKAAYSLASERGTILKLSPDRSRREIFATGVRFSFTLAFNRKGDLFITDQEGATWLPGGNPLDELNHIEKGRHYGFPFRHETHLPGVADVGPVAVFSPQHQSTCGMTFNEAAPGRASFGPAAWEGEALVAGYSRGKIWRVPLEKTPAGYAGRPILLGALTWLTADIAVSPGGDLAIACHSGPPDWGTGPRGDGRLFKATYVDKDLPQPLLAWAAGPFEARIAFDRQLDSTVAAALAGGSIDYGEYARPGDRFEVHRPPYAVVQAESRAPRGRLAITGASLADGGRTLRIKAGPHSWRASYVLAIPSLLAAGAAPGGGGGEDVTRGAELGYDLSGVEADWEASGPGEGAASAWLPHLDLDAAFAFARGSAEHERFRGLLGRPGRLRLRTRVELPEETAFEVESARKFALEIDGERIEPGPVDRPGGDAGGWRAAFAKGGRLIALSLEVSTGDDGGRPPRVNAGLRSRLDGAARPLTLDRLLLPWASVDRLQAPKDAGPPPELQGGDWVRGEEAFFSPEAKCSTCHTVRGKGGRAGPDLTNLVHLDAAAILRNIVEPSESIHPDYVPYVVLRKDGQALTGIVRAGAGGGVLLMDASGKETEIPAGEIAELRAESVSIMPKGLPEGMPKERLTDLLTFLSTPRPPDPGPGAPPPRSKAEVRAVLAAASPGDHAGRVLRIVLVAGPKDHGPGEHDYPLWQARWKGLLAKSPRVRVSVAFGWPERAHWDLADVMVFYFWNHQWSGARYADLDAFIDRGGGVAVFHSATIADSDPEKLAERIGLAARVGPTKYRHGPIELEMAPGSKDHPITRGLGTLHLVDESYWPLFGDARVVEVLATSVEEGEPRPMAWTLARGKGRVFATILGHYSWTFDDPLARVLMLRGIAWAADEPASALDALALEGARVTGD